ncbi:MAG: hypothetical protein RBR86_08515 [Pseudobdellovibrionaceae bacterium]|jgi:hypothetical protein|nr:hypothetical protein [Pseudobdellovibrionaceae bacterium]
MHLSTEFVRQKFVDLRCTASDLVRALNLPDTPLMSRVMQHKITEFSTESASEREQHFDLLQDIAMTYLDQYGRDYFHVSNSRDIPDKVAALILWLSPIDRSLPEHVFDAEDRAFASRLVGKIGAPHLMNPDERYVDLVETHFEYSRCAEMVISLSKMFSSNPIHSIECIRNGCSGGSRLEQDTRSLLNDVMRTHFSLTDRKPFIH